MDVIFSLEPNCPFQYVAAKLSAAKFSYLGAKLSVCLLGAKLSVFTILVPNCLGAKLSCAKLSYHLFDCQSSMTLFKCFQFVKNHHYSLVLECHRSPLLVLFAEVIVNGLCVMRFRLNSINFLQSEEKGSVWRRKILGKRQKQRRWIFFPR